MAATYTCHTSVYASLSIHTSLCALRAVPLLKPSHADDLHQCNPPVTVTVTVTVTVIVTCT